MRQVSLSDKTDLWTWVKRSDFSWIQVGLGTRICDPLVEPANSLSRIFPEPKFSLTNARVVITEADTHTQTPQKERMAL